MRKFNKKKERKKKKKEETGRMRGNERSELKEIHNCASQRLCLMKNGSEPSGDLFKEDVLPYSCNPRDTVSSL